MNKKAKKLFKYYKKVLKVLSKYAFTDPNNFINYFYIYLMYVRDLHLLFDTTEAKDNQAVLSISVALQAYNEYASCINKYYNKNGKKINVDESDEDVQKKYAAEKAKYLDTFFVLIKMNFESWVNTL